MSDTLLYAAEAYLDRGLSIIPMRDKKPAVRWKRYQAAPPTGRHLNRWFRDGHKNTGLAIIFGSVSGNLGQRDFDTLDAYKAWSQEQPTLAATLPTAATRRGFHVYGCFDPAEVAEAKRAIGSTGNGSIKLPGGELRADVGCYSVAPCSRHPSGFIYKWVKPFPAKVPTVPLATFFQPPIDVSPECYTCNVSAALVVSVEDSATNDAFLGKDLDSQVQKAIDATLPKSVGDRNQQVFAFVRWLIAIPQLRGRNSRDLEPLIMRWHAQALPFIGTKELTATLIDFHVAWKRAKVPIGTTAIGPIFARAAAAELPEVALRYADEPQLQLLVSLCRELQRSAGAKPFFLSCYKAAELLSVLPMQAWRWLELLQVHGVIEVTTKGTTGRKGKATEFRYRGER
jgi:hypothetical protein